MGGDGSVMKRKRIVIMSATALVVMAAVARAQAKEAAGDVPADAAGWYGALSLYRAVATWAGKRALLAEAKYWEAVS